MYSAVNNQTSAVPPHVPEALIFDYDINGDPRLAADIHDGLLDLRRNAPGPIFYTPLNGGSWIVIGYQECYEIARNFKVFGNDPSTVSPELAMTPRIPVSFDPPQHSAYRRVLMENLGPRQLLRVEPDIHSTLNDLIDAVIDEGRCDFVPAIAEPLPVWIFMRMMGFPLDRYKEFRVWVSSLVLMLPPEVRQQTLDLVMDMSAPLVRERMETRQDDLISRLIDSDIDGRKPTFDEIQAYCLMLFIAGLDTVVNAMSFGMRHLARDHALQDRLRTDPTLIPPAVEELLRRYSFANPGRIVREDFEAFGVSFRRGDQLTLLLSAADLDESQFQDATKVDIDRKQAHLAFNAGPHRCVGLHLARLELQALYKVWLERMPRFSLDPEASWRFHQGVVHGVESLPLVWNPAENPTKNAA